MASVRPFISTILMAMASNFIATTRALTSNILALVTKPLDLEALLSTLTEPQPV